jgi:hypothetical protein
MTTTDYRRAANAVKVKTPHTIAADSNKTALVNARSLFGPAPAETSWCSNIELWSYSESNKMVQTRNWEKAVQTV